LAPFQDGKQSFVAAAIRDITERRSISDALDPVISLMAYP